jgi:Holliday junction resolvase
VTSGRGVREERKLANRLEKEGWFVTRAAGSGTAQRSQVDLVAINREAILLIECKTYEDETRTIPIEEDKVQMRDIMQRVGMERNGVDGRRDVMSIIAIKQKGQGVWKFVDYNREKLVPEEVDTRLYEILVEYNDQPQAQ